MLCIVRLGFPGNAISRDVCHFHYFELANAELDLTRISQWHFMPECEQMVGTFYRDLITGEAEAGLDLQILRPIGEVRPKRASPLKKSENKEVKVNKVKLEIIKKVKAVKMKKEKKVKLLKKVKTEKEKKVKIVNKAIVKIKMKEREENERNEEQHEYNVWADREICRESSTAAYESSCEAYGYGHGNDACSAICFSDSDEEDA